MGPAEIVIARWVARPEMKRIAASRFLILFLLTFGSFAHAQSKEWASLNNEARLLYKRGQYDQAVVLMNQALDVAQKEWGNEHPNVAQTLNNLGLIYEGRGEYAQRNLFTSVR